MIDLDEVGARTGEPGPAGVAVTFGVYLPGIDMAAYEVVARVIHEADRFRREVQPLDVPLAQVVGHPAGLWNGGAMIGPAAGTSFGLAGTYLYRYRLLRRAPAGGQPEVLTSWFTDPFARRTDDVGQLSATVTEGAEQDFAWTDDAWRVPELDRLVVYELHVEEFNGTFDGVRDRLSYLRSLGVTCLELMPVTSLKRDFDWGYGPLHYFAPNQRWGGAEGLKRLVDACHALGIAVILDVVYQHVDPSFPYHLVYADAGVASPMIGGWGTYGPEIDFSQEFAREYVTVANLHWLREYHIDGFRYDDVNDLYDGPTDQRYARLAYVTYGESLSLPRFTPSGAARPGEYSRIIQVPEALRSPQEILRTTYSNGTWQDGLLGKAEWMAETGQVDDAFIHLLDTRFSGYPDYRAVHDSAGGAVDMPVAPFQYVESHDHSQLVAFLGGQPGGEALAEAKRPAWYRLQPFAIALYTCAGIPMLWQGQEFADDYVLPPGGDARIALRRDVHWEDFYDSDGSPLVRLYRRLGSLRESVPALRGRDWFYFNQQSRPADGVVGYQRGQVYGQSAVAVVLLNFSNTLRPISVPFGQQGTYRERIDDDVRDSPYEVVVEAPGDTVEVLVPSNYGYVFVRS